MNSNRFNRISLFDRLQLEYDYYKSILSLNHKGIYVPIYNGTPVDGAVPDIYNKYGEKMDVFYFRDFHSAHVPYGYKSRHFIWDRYNYGLDTHFYSNKMMLNLVGKPARKYGMMLESREVAGKEYAFIEKNISRLSEFKKVFTYDDIFLDRLSNACFFPAAATVWYKNGNLTQDDAMAYKRKSKGISIISSSKGQCEMHRCRVALAWECKKKGIADTYGTFDGSPWKPSIDQVFADYRYSIAIENSVTDYYFTEKILNCFAAQAIPIYVGAKKIGDFFNPDGIISIRVEQLSEIDNVLRQCTKEEYENRLSAVLDNYERVKKYVNLGDILYDLI